MTINDLIYRFPRALIVSVCLIIAIALAFLNDPPNTICDVQKDVIQQSQIGFLYLDPDKKHIKTLGYKKLKEKCYHGNSPGACLQFFSEMSQLEQQLRIVPSNCQQEVLQIKELKQVVPDTLKVLQDIAWNGKPPKSRHEMRSWLDSNHMQLFCRLKLWRQMQLDRNQFSRWREQLMQSLPGADKLNRKDLWERVLFSVPCTTYVR